MLRVELRLLSYAAPFAEPNRSFENASNRRPPGDEINHQHNQRDDQQHVDKASRHMEAEPKEPQDQQQHKDNPKHEIAVAIQILNLQPVRESDINWGNRPLRCWF